MSPSPATADDKKAGPFDVFVARFEDPRVRTLLFTGLGGLAMLFAVLFLRGSDAGGFLIAASGAAGLVMGWRGSPVLVLLTLLYFLIFPDGIPPAYEDEYELAEGSYRPPDLLLAAALVVYLAAHYRLYGVTTQALPADADGAGKKARPRRRPAELIRKGELPRLLYTTAAAVVAGQIVWAVVTNLEVDVLADFPLRFIDEPATFRRTDPGDLAAWRTRLIAVAGLLFFGTLLARLVFGYWRLRVMTPAQGAMLLMDAGWDETRRERVRVETWRVWGVTKVADRVRAGQARRGKKR